MRFRRKPLVIEAMQFPYNGIMTKEFSEFIGVKHDEDQYNWLDIGTLSGTIRVRPGHWIIKRDDGDLYPCKPDIFEILYEEEK